MTDETDGRDVLAGLLPFYVNGTLPAKDRARVEDALAQDADLRAGLEEVRAMAALVRTGGRNFAPDAATSHRLSGLLARIEAESGTEPAPELDAAVLPFQPRQGVKPRPWFPEAVWKPAFAATLILAIVQAGVIGYQIKTTRQGARAGEEQATYETLSGARTVRPAGKIRLLMRLMPEARWADVETLLSEHDLTIIDGPHGGVLTLAVETKTEKDAGLAALRASPLVAFAGPAS